MCGITGYINLNDRPIHDSRIILGMLGVQKHRGPDDTGIRAFSLRSGWSLEIGTHEPQEIEGRYESILGFNRLSILDLSMNGHQPMISQDGKILLTLNGEIYNAFDYKDELKKWGYRFKSTTDTEVVLALFLKYGFKGMLERLNGMFAIVIADLGNNRLFITRDRFGIKPMYYLYNQDVLAFSSELKSFEFIDNFSFRLNEKQLNEYILFRNNISGTLFKDIQSLDPGHYLTFSHQEGLKISQFYNINNSGRASQSVYDLAECRKNLENWLSKSVTSQLMSDVKLGCQLSGGVDSSLVTWLANKNTEKKDFEAVSIIFSDKRFSEEQYIDRITGALGIISHKFILDSDYYLDNIEKATWHLEEPLNHPNTVAIYYLSQRAKEHVTVLLSGEGADEIFGGYRRFYDLSFPFRPRRVLNEIRKNSCSPSELKDYFNSEYRAVMATSYLLPAIARMLLKEFRKESAIESRRDLFRSLTGSFFDRQVKYEIKTYLPDLLIRQDKMSMAHSIENRVPFLDNDVVENSFLIPEEYLLLRRSPEGYNTEKYLLKKIMADAFGNDLAFRRKMGFGIPVREFFLNKRFTEYLNDKILPGIKKRGVMDSRLVLSWLPRLKDLGFHELEAMWIVISFEIWASIYLDKVK